MNESVALYERTLLHIRAGRSLAFSPEWRDDGLSVLFDRNSGDYWVISAAARKAVEQAAAVDHRLAGDLLRIVVDVLSEDERRELAEATAASVLDQLVELDILIPAALAASGIPAVPEHTA